MGELRAVSEGVFRAQTEGGRAMREAGLAKRHVQRLASENAALVGHNNSKQKIKHLQVSVIVRRSARRGVFPRVEGDLAPCMNSSEFFFFFAGGGKRSVSRGWADFSRLCVD